MGEVTRYEFELFHCNGGDMSVSEDGGYVSYDDYQSLEKKLTDMAVQLANAESKCRELAAELSAVDKIHNEAVFITDDHYEQCPPEVQKMIRSLAVLQIPAYYAFLAEVRACALEYYANLFKDTVNMDVKHNQEFHKGTLYVADQLRKGASL